MIKQIHFKTRRALALVIVFMMIFSSTPTQAYVVADSEHDTWKVGENIVATLTKCGKLLLEGSGKMDDFNPDCPAPWNDRREEIRTLSIEEGITSIGAYSFYGCRNLTGKLIIPDSVVFIGSYAFSGNEIDDAPHFNAIINYFEEAQMTTQADAPNEAPIETPSEPSADQPVELALDASELPIAPGDGMEEPVTPSEPIEQPNKEESSEPAATPDVDNTTEEPSVDIPQEDPATEDDFESDNSTQDPSLAPNDEIVLISEQILGENIFLGGQNGVYYCSNNNTTFIAVADAAGYIPATELVQVTYSDMSDHSYQTLGLVTEYGLLLEDFCEPLERPQSDASYDYEFIGWYAKTSDTPAVLPALSEELVANETKDSNEELSAEEPLIYAPWLYVEETVGTEFEAVFTQIPKMLKEQTIETSIDGQKIIITGNLPDGATVHAEQIPLDTARTLAGTHTQSENISICFALDITILVDGVKYQPADYGESVRVSVLTVEPASAVTVLHVSEKADGQEAATSELPAQVKDGAVEFTIDSFSTFIGFSLPSTVWDGTADKAWYDASATSFTLTTAEQLAGLAQLVNEGNTFEGKTVTLANDIVLNVAFTIDSNGVATATDGTSTIRQWTPIGANDPFFCGTFNGAGHSVNGLYINSLEKQKGLFGRIADRGTVKQLIVSGSVTADSLVGGLAAVNAGTIIECTYSGYVSNQIGSSSHTVGGLVGNNTGMIQNCVSTADVDGRGLGIGGLVGQFSKGLIQNSYSTGNVKNSFTTANNNYTGGLVGYMSDGAGIQNCYSVSKVNHINGSAGGLAGNVSNSTVTNSYFIKTASINETLDACPAGGTLSSLGYFTDANGTLTESNSTTLAYENNLLTALNRWVVDNKATNPTLKYWEVKSGVNSGYPVLTDSVPILPLTGNWADEGNYDTSWYFAAPDATEYHLTTPEQLAGLAVIVNGDDNTNDGYYQTKPGSTEKVEGAVLITTANTMTGKTIYLDNDISLNNGELDSSSRQWTPIGINTAKPFSGTFGGNGHRVSGLYLNGQINYGGLFGVISNGAVRNLTVSGEISCLAELGGIAGRISGTTVESCLSAVTISGTTYLGGIAGYAGDSSHILNSSNTGSVTCSGQYAAGIVGYAVGLTVQNCYNEGDITCTNTSNPNFLGGIVGITSSTVVKNCYNTGNVAGERECIGGIVGQVRSQGIIENCYSTGSVSATSYDSTGGVAGELNGNPMTVRCGYYLKTSTVSSAYNAVGVNVGQCSSLGYFTNSTGTLATSNSTSLSYGTNLLAALNGWVASNKATYPELKYWTEDASVNGGYPTFTDTEILVGNWADEGNYDTSWFLDDTTKTEYTISKPEQLAGLAVLVNGTDSSGSGYYKTQTGTTTKTGALLNTVYSMSSITITLAGDISLNTEVLSRQWTPIGSYTSTTDNKPFSGIFEGNHCTVSGLYIKSSAYYQGLFGFVSGGTIQNLATSGSVSGGNYVGGLVGRAVGATLNSLENHATVTGEKNDIGGLIGYNDSGKIINCYNTGDVNGDYYVGGLAGLAGNSSYLYNSYNTGTVTARTSYVGGLLGRNYKSQVSNCYNIGAVASGGIRGTRGGLVGLNSVVDTGNSFVQFSYFLKAGANSSLYAISQNGDTIYDSYAKMTGLGYFSDNAGILTIPPQGAETLRTQQETTNVSYGTNLLDALNGWVDEQTADDLSGWKIVEGENNGYPVFGDVVRKPMIKGTEIFANGVPLLIKKTGKDGTSDLTTVYVDNGVIGTYEDGTDTPIVGLTDQDLSGYTIYGGAETNDITADTSITMLSGGIAEIYGGGKSGSLTGNTNVLISGGLVTGNIYGGGNSGNVIGNTKVNVGGMLPTVGMTGTIVFGGGHIGDVIGSTDVTVSKGDSLDDTKNDYYHVFGGGHYGDIDGNTNVSVRGGRISNFVFGGGYGTGNDSSRASSVTGNTTVVIEGGSMLKVFGGGCYHGCNVGGSTSVTVKGGSISENVFGGGYGNGDHNAATVAKNTAIQLTGGYIAGNISGNGDYPLCTVGGTRTIEISGNPQVGTSTTGIDLSSFTANTVSITGSLTGDSQKIHLKNAPSMEIGTIIATGALADADAWKLLLNDLPLSKELSKNNSNIAISYANISATVPLNMTIAVKADGTMVAPDKDRYTIKSTCKMPIKVAGVSWELVNGAEIFADPAKLTLSINNTVIAKGTTPTIPAGNQWQAAASDGTTPTVIPLDVKFALGVGNTIKLADPTTETQFCTITYTLGYVE